MNTYYNSYILPIFDYGCLIWGRCSRGNTFRLLKLQIQAARIILDVDIITPSRHMFTELKWLPFPYRVHYGVQKSKRFSTRIYNRLFVNTPEVHSRNLRSTGDGKLRVPKTNGTLYDNSFAVSAAKFWNSLPTTISKSNFLNRFKTTLKVYVLNEASKEPA